MNLYLIGYRGTGKSTVARLAAQRLGMAWLDADEELERRAGRSIAQIFADGGEGAFRDLESQILADLAAREDVVLALGGGVVLRDENRRILAARGKVVWLRASAATIERRIAADPVTAARRPNLTATGGSAEIRELLALREPLYRACANFEIDTQGKTPDEVAAEIAMWVRREYGTLGPEA